ncbi:MAG: hypothetical protein Q7T51_04920 [Candidatus Moranbacteria bacterium]|nr:hypothetical protein [Candidatus Moranbacteria bacterium]
MPKQINIKNIKKTSKKSAKPSKISEVIVKKKVKAVKKVAKKEKPALFRRYLWLVVVFLVVAVIGVVAFLIYFFNRPVSGTSSVQKKIRSDIASVPFERFETKYLSFRHAASFLEKSHQVEPDAANVVLERALFSEMGANSKKIALTVENLVGRTMEDSGNYNFRASNSEKYQKEKFALGDLSGISFSSAGEGLFEKTFFIPRENFLVALAFSSPVRDDEEWNAEIENILRSIQWKK